MISTVTHALGMATGALRLNVLRSLLTVLVSPVAVAGASGVSAAVRILFGFYPTFKASRLNPIEALRHQ